MTILKISSSVPKLLFKVSAKLTENKKFFSPVPGFTKFKNAMYKADIVIQNGIVIKNRIDFCSDLQNINLNEGETIFFRIPRKCKKRLKSII